MKKMKHIMLFLLIGLAIPRIVLAQGTFPNLYDYFTFDFSGAPLPLEITTTPVGDATLPGDANLPPLPNDFSMEINTYSTEATDIWFLQKGDDGSFTQVFEFTGSVLSFPSFTLQPSGITTQPYYRYSQDWLLTDNQANSLLGGQWYVQIDFGSDNLLGKIGLVPEPSSAQLFLCGIGFVSFCYGSRKISQYDNNQ